MRILEFLARLFMAAFWLMLALLYLAVAILTLPLQAVMFLFDFERK